MPPPTGSLRRDRGGGCRWSPPTSIMTTPTQTTQPEVSCCCGGASFSSHRPLPRVSRGCLLLRPPMQPHLAQQLRAAPRPALAGEPCLQRRGDLPLAARQAGLGAQQLHEVRRQARRALRAAAAAAALTRVRCVSIFLDKNRRYIGKSQSKRKPKRTQQTPHLRRKPFHQRGGQSQAPQRPQQLLGSGQRRLAGLGARASCQASAGASSERQRG
eukprot:COSAG01_NODE_2445_length_7675_cov_30.173036_6_plen_214_part_00